MKNKLKKVFQPPTIVIIFLIISTIILLVYSLGNENANLVIKYFAYLYSTYALVVVIANIKKCFRFLKTVITSNSLFKKTKEFLYKNKYIKKFFVDKKFKSKVLLYISLVINFIFIFIKLHDGITYKSSWFISLAIYYIILTIIKYFLLRNFKETKTLKEEYKIYTIVGAFLMLLNIILTGMIIQMIVKNVATVYDGYVIYATATYTFYLIILAIINVVRYRRLNSPIITSVKVINLCTAIVSVLMLQTTMIATFSGSASFLRLMNTITGSAVALLILAIATFMIIKGVKKQKV